MQAAAQSGSVDSAEAFERMAMQATAAPQPPSRMPAALDVARGLAAELSESAHDAHSQALQDSEIVFTVHATSFFVVRIVSICVTPFLGYLYR